MRWKDTMSDNGIRNLEELREDDGRRMPRGVTLAFVVLGGACVGFAALALGGRSTPPQTAKNDPLGELVSSRAAAAPPPSAHPPPISLASRDVTFPRAC
jgi:DedD protein